MSLPTFVAREKLPAGGGLLIMLERYTGRPAAVEGPLLGRAVDTRKKGARVQA